MSRQGSDSSHRSGWSEIDQAIETAEADAKRLPAIYRDTLLPDGAIVLAHFIGVEAGNVPPRLTL